MGEVSVAYLPARSLPVRGTQTGAQAGDSFPKEDSTAAARKIWNFAKQLGGEKLTILGGIFEGRFIGGEEMREIATIPAIPVLRGMFVNVINSPIQGLVVALSAIAEKKQ